MFLWQRTFFSPEATSLVSQMRSWVTQGTRMIWSLPVPFSQRPDIRSRSWGCGRTAHQNPLVTSSTALCPQRLTVLEHILVSLATQELNSSANTSALSTDVRRTNGFLSGHSLPGGRVSTHTAKSRGGDLSMETLGVQAPSLFCAKPNWASLGESGCIKIWRSGTGSLKHWEAGKRWREEVAVGAELHP